MKNCTDLNVDDENERHTIAQSHRICVCNRNVMISMYKYKRHIFKIETKYVDLYCGIGSSIL